MKFKKPNYIDKYIKKTHEIKLESGELVNIYTFDGVFSDECKNEWAKHILRHYIDETGITNGANINKISKSNYIKNFILPSVDLRRGSEMSGEFGEIVFSDFIEYVLNYTVPRYKLFNTYPGNPQQGIDIIAYRINEEADPQKDTIVYIEVKARLSYAQFKVLQEAVDNVTNRNDKDFAVAVDFARRKLIAIGCEEEASEMERFSDTENPCIREKMAGLITSADNNKFSKYFNANIYTGVKIRQGDKIETHLIYSDELNSLAKELWERACL